METTISLHKTTRNDPLHESAIGPRHPRFETFDVSHPVAALNYGQERLLRLRGLAVHEAGKPDQRRVQIGGNE